MTRPVRRSFFLALLAVPARGRAGGMCAGEVAAGSGPGDGQSSMGWEQIAGFFWANQPAGSPCLSVSIEELAGFFVWEGNVENVRGDIAFAQSLAETGWFRYGGQVQCWQNNYGGLGAIDGGAQGASFPDANTGVRAQIQHLRAYADSSATSCSQPPLHAPCANPRFSAVQPKGKASTWNQMGNGNWATSPNYASNVINMYNRMRAYAGLPPV